MAFCSNCGVQLSEEARFCPACGASVGVLQSSTSNVDATPVPPQNYVQTPTPVASTKKKKKSFLKILFYIIIGFIAFIIIVSQIATLGDTGNSSNLSLSKEEYIADCIQINYEDVARNPDSYKNKNIVVAGTVIQVQEGIGNSVILRVAEDGMLSDKIWYVNYTRKDSNESRVLENDYITLYGVCNGVTSYKAVLGNTITIPCLNASYIENGKVVNGRTISYNITDIANALEYKEYKLDSMFAKYYFLTVKNTSEYDIEITGKITFYKGDDIVAVNDCTSYATAPGQEILLWTMPDEEYTRTEVSFDVSQCSFSKPAIQDFEYEIVNQTSSKLIIKGKNTGDQPMTACAQVLFFQGDKIVEHNTCYFSDNEYELKGNSTLTEEVTSYESFDNYIIFVDAYRY